MPTCPTTSTRKSQAICFCSVKQKQAPHLAPARCQTQGLDRSTPGRRSSTTRTKSCSSSLPQASYGRGLERRRSCARARISGSRSRTMPAYCAERYPKTSSGSDRSTWAGCCTPLEFDVGEPGDAQERPNPVGIAECDRARGRRTSLACRYPQRGIRALGGSIRRGRCEGRWHAVGVVGRAEP